MNLQNWLMVNEETNIVDNICVWDGNSNTWQPPINYLMLEQANTPAKIWELNAEKTDYVIVVVDGAGQIGFEWDGTFVATKQPKPELFVIA